MLWSTPMFKIDTESVYYFKFPFKNLKNLNNSDFIVLHNSTIKLPLIIIQYFLSTLTKKNVLELIPVLQ